MQYLDLEKPNTFMKVYLGKWQPIETTWFSCTSFWGSSHGSSGSSSTPICFRDFFFLSFRFFLDFFLVILLSLSSICWVSFFFFFFENSRDDSRSSSSKKLVISIVISYIRVTNLPLEVIHQQCTSKVSS